MTGVLSRKVHTRVYTFFSLRVSEFQVLYQGLESILSCLSSSIFLCVDMCIIWWREFYPNCIFNIFVKNQLSVALWVVTASFALAHWASRLRLHQRQSGLLLWFCSRTRGHHQQHSSCSGLLWLSGILHASIGILRSSFLWCEECR